MSVSTLSRLSVRLSLCPSVYLGTVLSGLSFQVCRSQLARTPMTRHPVGQPTAAAAAGNILRRLRVWGTNGMHASASTAGRLLRGGYDRAPEHNFTRGGATGQSGPCHSVRLGTNRPFCLGPESTLWLPSPRPCSGICPYGNNSRTQFTDVKRLTSEVL